ncbi:MAG: hypothetical protein ACRYFS_24535 [Janthinobacterium lividum]
MSEQVMEEVAGPVLGEYYAPALEESEVLDLCDLHGVKEAWRPTTEEDADWVLAQINEQSDKIERIKKNYQSQLKAAEGRKHFFEDRYGPDLERLAKHWLLGKKARTHTLLNGLLKLVKTPARIVIDKDDARVVAWAKATGRGEMVKTTVTESVDRTKVAKLLKIVERLDEATGERVAVAIDPVSGTEPGVATVTPEGERFSIK